MKKIISIMIAVMLISILLAMPTQAAGTGKLSMGTVTGQQGGTVKVNVVLSNNPGLASMSIKVSYDTSVLELTNVTDPQLLKGSQLNPNYGSPYKITWADTSLNNNTKNGTIATFTFKIKDTAAIGSTKVTLEFLDSFDVDQGENTFTAESGTIKIVCKNHSYGEYSSKGTSQHSRTCSTCNYVETEKHKWDKGTEQEAASCQKTGKMFHECTACGETKTETVKKQAHTYDHGCDKDCNVCGEERTTEHSYGTEWKMNGTQHWHACEACGDKQDRAAHDFKETASGTQICQTCEYEQGSTQQQPTTPEATDPDGKNPEDEKGSEPCACSWLWIVTAVLAVALVVMTILYIDLKKRTAK